jgi:predicted phage terminase large subunit-like protein
VSDRRLERYAEILRNDFAAFAHRAYLELYPDKAYESNWHIEVVAEKLDAVRRGECRRLIINVPPRSMKSILGSIVFPAFVLGHYPSAEVLCVSYGEDPVKRLALPCRTLMLSRFYQSLFQTRLSEDKLAIEEFKTTAGGGRTAVSLGGAITGQGADFLIIDDPLKVEEGKTDSARARVNESYDSTVSSRANRDSAAIILIMQRLHANDLAGYVQRTSGEHWDVVALPALAEQDEVYRVRTPYGLRTIHRPAGQALQPWRVSEHSLRIRKKRNERAFSAEYQQKPYGAETAIVRREWFGWYDKGTKPEFEMVLQSWDTATRTGETNSYSVCTTWGVRDSRFYLIGVVRERFDDYRKLKQAAISIAKDTNPTKILIEDQSSGYSLLSDLREAKFKVHGISPGSASKADRLEAQVHRFERGEVLLPRESETEQWLSDYIDELTTFPESEFNDQVDSTTQALVYDTSNTRFNNAMGAIELLTGDPNPETGGTGKKVKLRVLQAAGMMQFSDGRPNFYPPPPGGTFEIDEVTANTLVQTFPKTYERVPD